MLVPYGDFSASCQSISHNNTTLEVYKKMNFGIEYIPNELNTDEERLIHVQEEWLSNSILLVT